MDISEDITSTEEINFLIDLAEHFTSNKNEHKDSELEEE